MRTRIAAAGLGIAAAASVPFVAAGPAEADSTDCFSGYVCMWEDPQYEGSRYVLDYVWPDRKYQIGGFNGDNEISSVYNHSDYCVRLYDNDDWTGTSYLVGKQRMVPNLKQNGYDNEAESYKVFSC